MTIQERIYAQLSKNSKTRFNKQKVELSLIDDLESLVSEMQNAKDEIQEKGSEISSIIFYFRDVLANFNTTEYLQLMQKYREASNNLGIDIDSKYQDALEEYYEVQRKWKNHFNL
jgi:signal transduction histidine kinase